MTTTKVIHTRPLRYRRLQDHGYLGTPIFEYLVTSSEKGTLPHARIAQARSTEDAARGPGRLSLQTRGLREHQDQRELMGNRARPAKEQS